jgi:hypothetical protein
VPSKITTPVIIRLENEIIAELDSLAEAQSLSRSAVARSALAAGLETLRKPAKREPERARRGAKAAPKKAAAPPVRNAPASAAKQAPAAKKPPATKVSSGPSPELIDFAARVIQAGQRSKKGRFGEDRILINHLWRQFKRDYKPAGMDLEGFKQQLLEANRERCLSLVCADMAPLLDQKDVRESEIRYLSATFHFLCI